MIFGCSYSRLAAEIIFDLGLGDAFVVRTAGHVIDNTVLGSLVLGSLEYSIDFQQVERITPSVLTSLRHDEHEVNDMVVEHVKQTAQRLAENSPIIATAVQEQRRAVVGLACRLAEGHADLVSSFGTL